MTTTQAVVDMLAFFHSRWVQRTDRNRRPDFYDFVSRRVKRIETRASRRSRFQGSDARPDRRADAARDGADRENRRDLDPARRRELRSAEPEHRGEPVLRQDRALVVMRDSECPDDDEEHE